MWCEMVGWVNPRPAVKSQMQIGPSALISEAIMRRRVGSASAFMSSVRRPAQRASTAGRAQHTPRSLITGSSLTITDPMLQYPSINVDGLEVPRKMAMLSEVKEAVRSRYANAAKQIAVLPADATGCCSVDGPDCGCAGAYSEAEMHEIGLTDAVSLGCGNPTMLADLKPGEV